MGFRKNSFFSNSWRDHKSKVLPVSNFDKICTTPSPLYGRLLQPFNMNIIKSSRSLFYLVKKSNDQIIIIIINANILITIIFIIFIVFIIIIILIMLSPSSSPSSSSRPSSPSPSFRVEALCYQHLISTLSSYISSR